MHPRFTEPSPARRRFVLAAGSLAGACLAPRAARARPRAAKKVIRMALRAAETGFDPVLIFDRYSVGVCENLFENLITYDYLARPVKLVPLAAEAVPEPEEGGTRYTFRIKPGIYFNDDPVFRGARRELVAADMEYAIKRFRDPVNRSAYEWLFEHNLLGLDELAERARKEGRFDYDAKVPGIEVRGRYEISFKLKDPNYNFLYFLAMPNVVPVAREVIEAYAADTMAHPVGTGPYVLREWVRRSKIVLERNPDYRGFELETRYADMSDEWDRRAVEALAGKRLPLVDRIEIYPIEDEQPRFLAFLNHEHDLIDELPFSFINQVLPNGRLAPQLASQGVRVFPELQPEITYDVFNVDEKAAGAENPLGGYTPERVALRRAMVLAHDRNQEISIIRKGQAIAAQSPIPPGVVGYDPNFRSDAQDPDPPRAKALLDMFGYVDRDGDGWRERPDGRPLSLLYKYNLGGQEPRELAELWVKCMASVGIRLEASGVQFADLLNDRRLGNFQLAGSAWIADYPDAQNFLQLLYGPNTDQSNEARFRLPEYDRLYERSLGYPDGPERNRLYREMTRLVFAYAPWRLGVTRIFHHLQYPWVKGYKKHPILYTNFRWLDVDVAAQQAAMK
ncbi:MAG TPA: ABC transporter substrate-binding protein [Usitatibacter sp.]|nr:ABC transporter substrate-binding protein [Usitatibacter sp.]